MSDAVYRSFLKPQPGYVLPDSFGTFDTESNRAIKAALARYIERATVRAAAIGLTDPQGRLDAFQDDAAKTRGEGQYFDDFFGWAESI
jgi:hypothetical protein